MMKYMISCQEATRLLSEKNERRLTLLEYIALSLRVMMCSATKVYKNQCESLEKIYPVGQDYIVLSDEKEGPKLPVDACDRIKKKLEG